MNQKVFTNYIDNPYLMDHQATPLLKGLLAEYPFCQSAQLLYARSLRNTQHFAFSSQLRVAAAYAGNRSILRILLQQEEKEKTFDEFATLTSQEPEENHTETDASISAGEHLTAPETLPIAEPRESKRDALSKDEIIERFIQSEPHITRPQKDFFNPVNYARQSVIDDETIVSETLAKIFLEQGHKEKAIKVYQKLSLVFPEKSTYFADLIKKLKKGNN